MQPKDQINQDNHMRGQSRWCFEKLTIHLNIVGRDVETEDAWRYALF